ncbi:MAG: 16S rRNA (guanine(966)-N(2))-methyltransferase RsmD [Phototrophicaceae bacterium]
MSHRVIAGSAKGRKLKLVPGDSTRPIMDRVKEALFSIIGWDILDANFLDLFAGTGSVGIEALSRGAQFATFVDMNRSAIHTTLDNLKTTGFLEQSEVLQRNSFLLLKTSPTRPYHYIYIAPPQYKNLWIDALKTLEENPSWIHDELTVIVQIDPKELRGVELQLKHLAIYDERTYGNTRLIFLEQKPQEAETSSTEIG